MNIDDKKHIACKVMAIVDELREQGRSPELLLQDAGLDLDTLRDPDTRISQRQILTVCRSAARICSNPEAAFLAGRRVHITHLGMFGYAVLNQPNMRAILDFALRYRPLSAPMIGLSVQETADHLNMIFTPILGVAEDSPEFQFILDFNIAMFANLSQDSLGSEFRVACIGVTAKQTPAARRIRDTFGVEVETEQEQNVLALPRELADASLLLANPITAAMAQKICDSLLADLSPESALMRRITSLLMQKRAEMIDFSTVAHELGVSQRTLRRRLQAEGTTFNEIRNGLRRKLAVQYLQDTSMTNDEPRWVCRRLQFLSRMEHHEQDDEQIFSRSARTCRTDGFGQRGAA